jgi:penicillin amidase/acyl-homoserine-lactone acylase
LRATANRLLAAFGRLDPTWGEVNRLNRDSLDLPLDGAADTLRFIGVRPRLNRDGKSIAETGDSFVMISTWLRDGRWQVDSVVPYGASQVPGSPHYADQAQLYAGNGLKAVPLTPEAVMAEATQIERPGKPAPRQPGAAPARPPATAPTPTIGVTQPAAAAERTATPRAVTR